MLFASRPPHGQIKRCLGAAFLDGEAAPAAFERWR
jgi:hypothetical protein